MFISSHFLNRFETKNREAGVEDVGGGLTEQDSLPVDLHDLSGLVLLHAVTFLVEFSEGVGDLVHEVTKRMKQEVISYPLEDFSEPK